MRRIKVRGRKILEKKTISSLSLEGVNLEGRKMEGFCKITILPFHFFFILV